MGALHAGHARLLHQSLRENKITVATLFVNPLQFGPKEDYKRYPCSFENDVRFLRKMGVQILFAPTRQTMYPEGYATNVEVQGLTETLCGSPRSRGPAHFIGVATVVSKLFNLARPTRAYFGMKDFQQLRVIERLNDDLNFGIKIIRCPTVREADGLAVSSRNAYLSPSERASAPLIYRTLQYGRKLLRSHPRNQPKWLRTQLKARLRKIPHTRVDYIELVDPRTLQPASSLRRAVLIAAAVQFRHARLIDNVLVH